MKSMKFLASLTLVLGLAIMLGACSSSGETVETEQRPAAVDTDPGAEARMRYEEEQKARREEIMNRLSSQAGSRCYMH